MERNMTPKQIGIPRSHVLEREFQSTVIEMAKAFGWEAFYIPDSVRAGAVGRPKGWPDLTLCHPEWHILIFVECKTDNSDSRLSSDQYKWLKTLYDCGETVQVWRPYMWDHIEAVLAGPEGKTWAALENGDNVGRFEL